MGQSAVTHDVKPVEIDWSNWSPCREGEVRSPCPAINSLANHSILPHSGRGITKSQLITVLQSAFNCDDQTARMFAEGAVAMNPHKDEPGHHDTVDLDHVAVHGQIEHDVSLSRDDVAMPGGNCEFSAKKWERSFAILKAGSTLDRDGVEVTNYKCAAQARFARVVESREAHRKAGKEWRYGAKEALLSYGESGLYLSVLGREGEVPLEWMRIFFEEERIPYAEGWRRPTALVTQPGLGVIARKMIAEYGHGAEEARIVAMGTVRASLEGAMHLLMRPISTIKGFFGGAIYAALTRTAS